MFFFFLGCNSEEETTNIELNLYNDYDEDLYILLNVWHFEIDSTAEVADPFNLSKNLVVNKLIQSNHKAEFTEEGPHPFNSTITLSQKEPVFIQFNKFDSIYLDLKVKEKINDWPIYVQLISFVKREIIDSKIECLVFHKKKLSIDLTKSVAPFDDNEMLDSINIFGYYDSLMIVPIEFKLFQE